MGVWDSAIFSNDLACDIRDHYREMIEDGVDDAEATRKTMAKYQACLDDLEDGTCAILALALTQFRIGRLDPVIRDRALAAIERGGDLSIWALDNPKLLAKRKKALAKAREQLIGPQPARARVKRPSRPSCDLVAGDVLALGLPAALRYCESCGFMFTGGVKRPVLRNCSLAELSCRPWQYSKC